MTYLWRDIDAAWWKHVKQAALSRDMNIREFVVWAVNVVIDNDVEPARAADTIKASST